MTIPTYDQIMLPLLKRLSLVEGEANVAMVLPDLAREFGLTEDEQTRRLPSGRQTYLGNRTHWAKFDLSRAGLVDSTRRGYFKITEEGRRVLQSNPGAVKDRKSLMQIPAFARWLEVVPDSQAVGLAIPPVSTGDAAEKTTPDEQIDTASNLLNSALEADLLARVRTIAPDKFEQLIVDLLIAMGFGGGASERGHRIGRSGDGGIDGVIREDALGLDAIYVQAKRYKDGNNIGAPIIQQFVGSLVCNRATKGVFVTSSKFTPDARQAAQNVQHRIVLIDGEELARLLVTHGVAVREDRRIVIKKLDEDYFSED